MEPDFLPSSSSPAWPDGGDAGGEVDSEEDEEFGDFSVGASPCDPSPGLTSFLFTHTVKQSQPSSSGSLESDQSHVKTPESSVQLTNGFKEGERGSEGSAFADFTSLAGQTAHPWCCGFSPASHAEQWDRKTSGTIESVYQQTSNSGRRVFIKSEFRSHFTGEGNNTAMEHTVENSQEQRLPQESVAGEEEAEEDGGEQEEEEEEEEEDTGGQRSYGTTSAQRSEEAKSPEDNLFSLSDDVMLECVSSDREPSASSQRNPTDDDSTTDDEEEEEENPNLGHSESAFHHFHQHNNQESNISAGCRRADRTVTSEPECVQASEPCTSDVGSLPPSDSFADFCSAPVNMDGGEDWWAEFKEQTEPKVGASSWTELKEPVRSLQTHEEEGEGEEEEEGEEEATHEGGVAQREAWKTPSSVESSGSARVQQLLESSFPEVPQGAAEEEERLLSLHALLHSEEEEQVETLTSAQRIQQEMLGRRSEDSLGAVSLRFQWGGSRVNRTLLGSLGVNTRNIVFMGKEKQPVTVPAFASSLGLLEPIKDPGPAVRSPVRTTVSTRTPSTPGDPPGPSLHSVQEELPSSPLDWGHRGLSSTQDVVPFQKPNFHKVLNVSAGAEDTDLGCSARDALGAEGGEAPSGSSTPHTPHTPPGLDHELLELSIGELGIRDHVDDALQRLMSTAERSYVSRKCPQDADVSVEASEVLLVLPDLSFMQAKVLMFPSVLGQQHISDI